MNSARAQKTAYFKLRFPKNGRFANKFSILRPDSICAVVGSLDGQVDHRDSEPAEIPVEVSEVFIQKAKTVNKVNKPRAEPNVKGM